MWSASPRTIRSARIFSSYWQLLLKKYILLKKKDCWKQNMCKWRLTMYVSNVLVFNVCWCEEDGLVTGLCTKDVVHCGSGNHYFPTVIWLLILRTSVLSILLKMPTSVLLVEVPWLLFSGGVTVRRSQFCATAVKVAYIAIALGNVVVEAEPSLWTQLCHSWQYH